jgi:hypothetical protein
MLWRMKAKIAVTSNRPRIAEDSWLHQKEGRDKKGFSYKCHSVGSRWQS